MGEQFLPCLVISVGAVLGANLRYAVGLLAVERFGAGFPYGTLFINVSGSLVIGFFLALALERLTIPPLWRLFFVTGFLGSYTTFSSYTFEAAALLREGAYGSGLLYLLGSVAGGLAAVLLGIALAEQR